MRVLPLSTRKRVTRQIDAVVFGRKSSGTASQAFSRKSAFGHHILADQAHRLLAMDDALYGILLIIR